MSQFNVSVIVVNYNSHTTLDACINSILLSKEVEELLLVDNASTDGSLNLIEKCTDARLKIIRLPRNVGLAKARNWLAIAIERIIAMATILVKPDFENKMDNSSFPLFSGVFRKKFSCEL